MKGFTLIELLAIIVILTVILLISVPMINDVIEESKKKSFEDTAKMLLKIGEINYAAEFLNGNFQETIFTYTDGVETSSIDGKKLDYKGKKPENGIIIINNEGKMAMAIHDGVYCAEKDFDSAISVIEKIVSNCTIEDIGEPTPPPGEVATSLNDTDADGFLEIWYLDQLAYINTNVTTLAQNYELMRNLNFQKDSHYLVISNKTAWTTGNGWLPMGLFTAKFNGQNKTISNLFINRPLSDMIGLFGRIINNDTSKWVSNVRLTNVNVTGRDQVGGLVGTGGDISNSYVQGNVTGRDQVGLLAGSISLAYITTSTNCSTSGTVTGNNYVGGVFGGYGGYSASKITSNATVIGNSSVGGLAGSLALSLVDSYSNATVTGNTFVGGIAGRITSGTIARLYSTGSITGTSNVGGITSSITGGTVANSYWDTQATGIGTSAVGTGYTTAQMKERPNYVSWDFFNSWGIRDDINNGYPCPQTVCNFTKTVPLLSLYDHGTNQDLWVEGYSNIVAAGRHEIIKNVDHLWGYTVGPLNQVTWVNDTPIEVGKYNKLNFLTDVYTMPVGGGGLTICFSKVKTTSYNVQCDASQKIQFTAGNTIEQRTINVLGLGLEGDYYIRFHTLGGSYMGNVFARSALYEITLD